MGEKNISTFMLRQRAFLKLYMITKAQNEKSYGSQIFEDLVHNFKDYGFRPTRSEIYKTHHELLEDGILKQRWLKKEGTKMQEIAIYEIADQDKAESYKKLLKIELDRCINLLRKGVQDNY